MSRRLRPRTPVWIGLLLASILVVALLLSGQAGEPARAEPTKIGFIGDSITHRPTKGNWAGAVEVEMAFLGGNYEAINRGVSGSSTRDWQPGHPMFDDALANFKTQNVHVVSIMLGTNDARINIATPPDIYKKNLDAIVNTLLASGFITQVIINYPPYAVPGSYGIWQATSLTRLKAYMAQIDTIVGRKGVALGDTTAYDFFQHHPEDLVDGVHPNAQGDIQLGRMWATAYKKIMEANLAKQLKFLFS